MLVGSRRSWNGVPDMVANTRDVVSKLLFVCIALAPIGLAGLAEAKSVLTRLPLNTQATAINDSGVVVGQSVGTAFVRTPDGNMTNFAINGANVITPTGINSSGVVTGSYEDANRVMHGFVRDATGAITTFDAPNACLTSHNGTWPTGINAGGVVTGYYYTSAGQTCLAHGFVRAVDGTITSFDVPNAFQTLALGENDKGEIVGEWFGTACDRCAFVRSPEGKITTFKVPGAYNTFAFAINGKGDVTGYYQDGYPQYTPHGFIRQRDGQYTTFDHPNVQAGGATYSFAINDNGTVAGTGSGNSKNQESPAFVRHRSGHMRMFGLPKSAFYPFGINNSGVVVGYQMLPNASEYGFIWTP